MNDRASLVDFSHPPVENPNEFQRDHLLPQLWHSSRRAAELDYEDGSEGRLLTQMRGFSLDCDPDFACETLVEDWPSQYHCDPNRRNLLYPLSHLIKGQVLEVGAGCGALTGFLAERADLVLALEGAPARAQIVATRHRQRHNLIVLADDFWRFRPNISFNTIVVVGVLEYAALFSDAGLAAPRIFLDRIMQMLAPGGNLLLAIENQFGLSYIGGMPEDHAGQPWFGVDNRYGSNSFRTFGRAGLANLLAEAGFTLQSWYYPFPDYKLPTLILAEEALLSSALDTGDLMSQCTPDRRFRPNGPGFAPGLAWKGAAQNGLIRDLADSFLVAATASTITVAPSTGGGLAWIFNTRRRPCFRKVTEILWQGDVVAVVRHRLARDEPSADMTVRQVLQNESFQVGQSYLDSLRWLFALGVPDIPALATWAADWVAYLKRHMEPNGSLPADFVDCTPVNLIRTTTGELFFFDREWHSHVSPTIEYVVFRGLMHAFMRLTDVLPQGVAGPFLLASVGEVMAELGFSADIDSLCLTEAVFQACVTGVDTADHAAAMKAKIFRAPSTGPSNLQSPSEANSTLSSAYDSLLESYTKLAAQKLQGTIGQADGLIGYIDGFKQAPNGRPGVCGWVWDRTRGAPADLVVLFLSGIPTAAAPVSSIRRDAAQALGADIETIGFIIPIPKSCPPVIPLNVTVIALSKGSMSILPWSSGAMQLTRAAVT